ncbi:MAG: ABC transporter permease [Candidatus Dormibacteraeota bacterium]|nr:ABC transporter permease [Candidatus Dormibacteraeota bacterium]
MSESNGILAIASRDVTKLVRDRPRLIFTFIFPLIFIGLMGGTLQGNLGRAAGFNFIEFIFAGVLGMTLFQSAAQGLISLIEDRENDFSQEMFVSPVSRYSIIFGKILGETTVSFFQAIPTIAFAILLRVPLSPVRVLLLLPAALAACLLGASFGVALLSLLSTQRAAQQILPFLMFPQFFLAGVFNPVKVLPWYLEVPSLIAPMRYAVDLIRGVVYAGRPEYDKVVLFDPLTNLVIMAIMFAIFLVFGTALFVRQETNR